MTSMLAEILAVKQELEALREQVRDLESRLTQAELGSSSRAFPPRAQVLQPRRVEAFKRVEHDSSYPGELLPDE